MGRDYFYAFTVMGLAAILVLFLTGCGQRNDELIAISTKSDISSPSDVSIFTLESYSITIVPTEQKSNPQFSITQSVDPSNFSPSTDAYPGPDDNLMAEPSIEGTPYPGPEGFENSSLPNLETTPDAFQSPQPNFPLENTPTSVTSTPPIIQTQLEATDPTTFRLANGQLQLVEFFAFWSPISKSIAPILNLLETRYGDRVNFVYLDIEDPANDLYTRLIGEKLPPVIFLIAADGAVIREWNGLVSLEELEQGLQSEFP